MGSVYYQLNQPDSAIVHWRASAAIRPEYASAHAMIANLEIDRHHTDEALAQADSALFRAGQKKDAVLAMRDFVRRHADDAHGWMFLGYIEAMSLHYSNALADWKTAVALDPKVLNNAANYQRMRTELSQIVPEPKAATVADLDLPIPPDPAPQRTTKQVILSGSIVVPQGNGAKSPATP